MKIFVQSSRCPSQVLFAFDDIAHSGITSVRWAVAYSTRAGCVRLVERIAGRMGKEKWEKSKKQFITSLDFGLTDPDALKFLKNLPESRVYIANADSISRPGFFPSRAYHPKLYLFDGIGGATGYVVGSANLTNSAMISNTEVVTAGTELPETGDWGKIWDELLLDTIPLTKKLLTDYRNKWIRPKKRAIDPDPKLPSPNIVPKDNAIFGDAILEGAVSPTNYNHFWIESGSMSSGGSRTQLELPRGANRFFDFNHSDYGGDHITIGHPTLTLRKQTWENRPLTWHGNNKMERINLPSLRQGGFEYPHTAILFRRHEAGFEINVLPWGDQGALAWRTASDALDKIFRIGLRTERICGLF